MDGIIARHFVEYLLFAYGVYLYLMMLLAIRHKMAANLHMKMVRAFARSNKQKWKSNDQEFEETKRQYTQDYFEQYRQQVEKDSVIRDFRRQVFNKESEPVGKQEYEDALNKQQRHMESLLKKGSPEQIKKNSRRIMQHISNERKMFKGYENKDIFKDYAEYSAYKTNKTQYDDRNYASMDNLYRGKRAQKTYEFVDGLPEDYAEKAEIREEIHLANAGKTKDITISDFGKMVQFYHDDVTRINATFTQLNHLRDGQVENQLEDCDNTIYTDLDEVMDMCNAQQQSQMGVMSSEAWDTIYQLYIQGWTVRDISKRFGILPARTKFMIWARARLYNEAVPRFGYKYLLYNYEMEEEDVMIYGACDYGIDLDHIQVGSTYESITSWSKHTVDTKRTPQKYTEALQKLQEKNKFSRYDMVQVGEHGSENKKHRLTEWRVHRGKGSDEYFLKNKVFQKLMFETRKVKSQYY